MSGQCHSGGLSRKTNKTNPLLTSSSEYVEQNANVSQFPGLGAIKWLEDTSGLPPSPASREVVQLINPLGCENTVEENPTCLVTNFMVMLGGKAG